MELTAPKGLVCVVLAGGSGTRLWPRSRQRLPKHLLPLAEDGRSLLRHAFERALLLRGEVLVVSAAAQAEQVARELPELAPDHLLLEPEPRGTGPALAWAALESLRLSPDAVMVSLHADHYIPDREAVSRVLLSAAWWAQLGQLLVTVGLRPSWPATGFGYVEMGGELGRVAGLPESALPMWRARGFVEKPAPAQAVALTNAGTYLWNTGLFAWPAALLLAELERFAPQVLAAVEGAVRAGETSSSQFAAAWGEVPSGVVERLVLERSGHLAVLPTELPWSDLGSFADLRQVAIDAGRVDGLGNVAQGEALLLDSEGCFVDSGTGRLVVILGGSGLAVIDTQDALLVCPLSRVQEVSRVVEQLREAGRSELL
ncbi:MAG: mannose-1-phosphate guanylyltransferase [Candidatus Dormibacteria bacterium]